MHSRWFVLTLGTVLALGVVLGAHTVNLSAQASDPRMGTWQLNAAKSVTGSVSGSSQLTVHGAPPDRKVEASTDSTVSYEE